MGSNQIPHMIRQGLADVGGGFSGYCCSEYGFCFSNPIINYIIKKNRETVTME